MRLSDWLSSVNQCEEQKYAEIICDFTEITHPTVVKTNSNQGMIVLKRGDSYNQQAM